MVFLFGGQKRDTLRRRFFEHSECYRKNCLTRDFGRPQGLSRPCGCVGELRSISHFHKKIKNHTQGMVLYFWRRWRDSNSRTAINSYTISNRAPSTGLGDISIFGHLTIIQTGDAKIKHFLLFYRIYKAHKIGFALLITFVNAGMLQNL